MHHSRHAFLCATFVSASVFLVAQDAHATVVGGGGSKTSDCVAVFDAAANSPAPPKAPKNIDCVDGDASCDADGLRNGSCQFDLTICINSTALADCAPQNTNSVTVDHAIDNGDAKFDPDFQSLQQRVSLLGFPANTDLDSCTTVSSVTVKLRPPKSGNVYKRANKRLSLSASGTSAAGPASDRDKMKMTCRPEGDGIYLPRDLYTGTFDRIRNQIFAQSCALSSCHDSQSATGGMILYPNVAYSQIVGVTPNNVAAATDGLQRVMPGDPTKSFLYRKIAHDLIGGYGADMPYGKPMLSPDQIELVRLWILGDIALGPAPQNGWVTGTDQ